MQPFVPKDTTFTKIFVGGLSYQTTDETLRQYFERFGEIEEAVVITDRQTGKSRGYGFVTMHTKEAASQAVCDPNPVIDGRKANVNLAYLGAKPRMLPSSAGIIPVQITNAYHALAAGTGYGVQPICYQPTQSLISTQPSLLLSAAGATSAPSGSQLIDLALQCPSPNLCQTHISLLDAAARTMPQAAAFYTTGAYSNSASAAALTVPGSSLQQFTVHPAHPTNALTYSTNGVFGNGLAAAAAAAQYPTAAFDNTGI